MCASARTHENHSIETNPHCCPQFRWCIPLPCVHPILSRFASCKRQALRVNATACPPRLRCPCRWRHVSCIAWHMRSSGMSPAPFKDRGEHCTYKRGLTFVDPNGGDAASDVEKRHTAQSPMRTLSRPPRLDASLFLVDHNKKYSTVSQPAKSCMEGPDLGVGSAALSGVLSTKSRQESSSLLRPCSTLPSSKVKREETLNEKYQGVLNFICALFGLDEMG